MDLQDQLDLLDLKVILVIQVQKEILVVQDIQVQKVILDIQVV